MSARRWLLSLVVLLPFLLPAAAPAETVVEAWRSPFGQAGSVSVNSSDGSCWIATRISVRHIAADGTVVSQTDGFLNPASVSANSTDGSCWVADWGNNQVLHLSASGEELWRSAGYPTFYQPVSVSVNSTDGSCWVADSYNNQVVHLAEDGTELWRGEGFWCPESVSVNSTDGSCWVADYCNDQVVHVSAAGAEL